jgi:hypothetical protein
VNGDVLTFNSTFQTINDGDGKFLYRVFVTENGEQVSEAVGATIPLPAGVWVGSGLILAVMALGSRGSAALRRGCSAA